MPGISNNRKRLRGLLKDATRKKLSNSIPRQKSDILVPIVENESAGNKSVSVAEAAITRGEGEETRAGREHVPSQLTDINTRGTTFKWLLNTKTIQHEILIRTTYGQLIS